MPVVVNGEEVKELATAMKKKLTIAGKKTKPSMAIKKESKVYPKILVVTHGGFIMEFLNLCRSMKGVGPSEKNSAKNTAIFVFRIECKFCQGVCTGKCKGTKELAIKILLENDDSHIKKK